MAASIIESLSISGSRKVDGTANASGKVWAYLPGTSTTAQLYSDAAGTLVLTQPLVLNQGGQVPAATAPEGVFTAIPIRLYIEDADGVVVSDDEFVPATAATVSVDNPAMSGATMDDVLTASLTSFGGPDFQYQESGGATPRLVQDKFREQWISVKDFGAKGDGVNIDTTAIQNAMNRAKAAGVPVYFPPTTNSTAFYKIDQALTLSNATGVSFIAPRGTTIKTTNTSANVFTLTSCNNFSMIGLYLIASSASTGKGVSLIDSFSVDFYNILIGTGSSNGFAIGIDATTSSGLSSTITVINTAIQSASGAGNRSIRITNTGGAVISNSFLSVPLGSMIEFAGSTNNVTVNGVTFAASDTSEIAVKFAASLTGTNFTVSGCPSAGAAWSATAMTIPFDMSALATDPIFRQYGNNVEGYTATFNTGTTQTPRRSGGQVISLIAIGGGAGTVTVAVPTPGPPASMKNVRVTLKLGNALGGAAAVTWALNANYVLVGAAAPSGTDGTTVTIEFVRDTDSSKWRELWRSQTAT